MYISDSVLYIAEGETFGYTVQLTHKPGVREDETVDLMNDEVRIYLTSSQEVYQQDDDSGGGTDFQQRVGHRTQLTIDTNVATNGATLDASGKMSGSKTGRASYTGPVAYAAGRAAVPGADDEHHEGPTPYYYVAYSTVNPSQASPTLACEGSTEAGIQQTRTESGIDLECCQSLCEGDPSCHGIDFYNQCVYI